MCIRCQIEITILIVISSELLYASVNIICYILTVTLSLILRLQVNVFHLIGEN
jgi:hypothetical protein